MLTTLQHIALGTLSVGLIYGMSAAARALYRPTKERPPRLPKRAADTTDTDVPTLRWQGYRRFVVIERNHPDASAQITSIVLAPEDERPLPPFKPGQYLTIRLSIPNRKGDVAPTVRCYSLSSGPYESTYRLSIKRVGPPADQPNRPPGRVSNFVGDFLHVGMVVEAKAPDGDFFLDESEARPTILIGGGIGITPVLSMVKGLADSRATHPVSLIVGMRTPQDMAFASEIDEAIGALEQGRKMIVYSQPNTESVNEAHGLSGHLTAPDILTACGYKAPVIYLCGPPAMMAALVPGFEDAGIAAEDIRFEAFGPASIPRRSDPPQPAVLQHAVTLHQSEIQFTWDGTSTLLESIEAAGVYPDAGCRSGNCGSCLTGIRSGTVHYTTKPATQVIPGYCLPCVAQPASPLDLDV